MFTGGLPYRYQVMLCFICLSAVKSMNTAMALSIYSTYSVEDVAHESPNTIKFLQMQFYTDPQLMVDLIKRAEKTDYKAVLLTVDLPVSGSHKKRANFSLPEHLQVANFSFLKKKKGLRSNKELHSYLAAARDSSVDWTKLDWLFFHHVTSFCSQRNIDSRGRSSRSAAWGSRDSRVKSWRAAVGWRPGHCMCNKCDVS